jgi:hypothetical protein
MRLFEKLDILPVSYQYILSLMLCVIDNQNNFYTSSDVLRLNTRKKSTLHPYCKSLYFSEGSHLLRN